MQRRASLWIRTRSGPQALGWAALGALCTFTALAFAGLTGFSGQGPDTALLGDPYFHGVVLFSLKQAALSAVLSVTLAWPVARALYYVPGLWWRRAFVSLCLLCFVMPTLVVVTGLAALLGQSGLITPLLGENWNLYGLNGILIAHVYLNMPFAVRVMAQQLDGIPESSWRLAAQLRLDGLQRFTLIEWPALRGAAGLLLGFIGVLCFNSFAVVLALGGGPGATTLEVALYQALKYDFNIPEALTLAWAQFAIAGLLFLGVARLGKVSWLSGETGRGARPPAPAAWRRRLLTAIYAMAWLALLLPMLALVQRVGIADIARFDWSSLLRPTLFTVGLALSAATLGITLAYLALLPVRNAERREAARRRLVLEWLATHTLVAPAMVLSVGLFILLLPLIDLDRWGLGFIGLLNALVVAPFAVQRLRPRLLQYDWQYARLGRSLKLSASQALRLEWGFVRPVAYSTFALVLVLAMGDVSVFAIFGTEPWTTLPWLIYRYASTYRLGAAAIASVALVALCALAIFTLERKQADA